MARTTTDGRRIEFTFSKSTADITDHIFITKNGRPYLHLIKNNEGTANVFKFCTGYGYLSMGELLTPFDLITINNIPLF